MSKSTKKHKLTVEVENRRVTAKLAEIAADLGLVARGGVGAGTRGSVGQLFQAIADGRVTVAPADEPAQ
jgi:hypothetical protein